MVNNYLTHTPNSGGVKKFVLIAACLLMLQSAASARAPMPCETIDEILYSASLVKRVQHAANDKDYERAVRELNTVASQIALPALMRTQDTGQIGGSFKTERAALFLYLSNIRDGASAGQSGFQVYSQDILSRAITPDLTQSLTVLEGYWNCAPKPPAEITAQVKMQTTEAEYNTGALADEDGVETQLPSIAAGTTQTARRFSGGGSTLPAARLDSVMPKASVSLFLLLAGLSFVIGVGYARTQSRKSRAREKRRLLNLIVPIKLGPVKYAVDLVDISMNGFKLQHDGVIKRDGKLHIELEGEWYLGQIKWHNKLFAGVKFKRPLEEDVLESVIEEGRLGAEN